MQSSKYFEIIFTKYICRLNYDIIFTVYKQSSKYYENIFTVYKLNYEIIFTLYNLNFNGHVALQTLLVSI